MNKQEAEEIICNADKESYAYDMAQLYLACLEGDDVKQMLREERKRVLESEEVKALMEVSKNCWHYLREGTSHELVLEEKLEKALSAFNRMKGELE